uniref:Glycoprotein n=1 Tax=Rhabditophanes sp. KR3021 TaxID=114890 RepID=A0AC35TPI7_9BILA
MRSYLLLITIAKLLNCEGSTRLKYECYENTKLPGGCEDFVKRIESFEMYEGNSITSLDGSFINQILDSDHLRYVFPSCTFKPVTNIAFTNVIGVFDFVFYATNKLYPDHITHIHTKTESSVSQSLHLRWNDLIRLKIDLFEAIQLFMTSEFHCKVEFSQKVGEAKTRILTVHTEKIKINFTSAISYSDDLSLLNAFEHKPLLSFYSGKVAIRDTESFLHKCEIKKTVLYTFRPIFLYYNNMYENFQLHPQKMINELSNRLGIPVTAKYLENLGIQATTTDGYYIHNSQYSCAYGFNDTNGGFYLITFITDYEMSNSYLYDRSRNLSSSIKSHNGTLKSNSGLANIIQDYQIKGIKNDTTIEIRPKYPIFDQSIIIAAIDNLKYLIILLVVTTIFFYQIFY